MSKRNPKVLGTWGKEGTRVVAAESYWREPLKWNAEAAKSGVRKRVFCASLADVFEDWQGKVHNHKGEVILESYLGDARDTFDESIGRWEECDDKQGWHALSLSSVRLDLFKLIDATPWLDWLLLTKRPENIRRMWVPVAEHYSPAYVSGGEIVGPDYVTENYRSNVWLGATCENQEQADRRIPELLKCRDLAPVLFLSMEPLLGPVDLLPLVRKGSPNFENSVCDFTGAFDEAAINWLIDGGESGPNARPSHPDWFRSLRDACAEAGVAYHHKQNGAWVDEMHEAARDVTDPKKFDDRFITRRGDDDYEGVYMVRVGERQAGRLLDGVLHDAIPVTERQVS